MHTLEFIKTNGIEALTSALGISVKRYPAEGLLVLNYSQIDSPKTHPVVIECRGLILDEEYNVVSRGFDRFFNHGEAPDHSSFDFQHAEICEKVDGSLIKIYNHDGIWHISTRGTAFAESNCNGFGTFRDLVLRSMPWTPEDVTGLSDAVIGDVFQTECDFWLDTDWTYIFEFTSVENRVVTRYEGYNLTFLAARHKNGVYGDVYEERAVVSAFNCDVAKRYKFDSIEHCLEVVKNLPDMQEGYVVYVDGKPVCKMKSPAYVAAHHIRSNEGLTPKNIARLVVSNETSEYLQYFEEDRHLIDPYVSSWDDFIVLMGELYDRFEGIQDQKEFALSVKDARNCSVLFSARKFKKPVAVVISELNLDTKVRMLLEHVHG
jgi:hypothetical protein